MSLENNNFKVILINLFDRFKLSQLTDEGSGGGRHSADEPSDTNRGDVERRANDDPTDQTQDLRNDQTSLATDDVH
jgi:hypothetical protein